jgi:anti-sigma regulatory factor (Ser/Thr protein kinase)
LNSGSDPKSVPLRFVLKDQADLTLAIMKVGQSGVLKGASHLDASLVKTIISELGTNIIKYAKRGTLTVERLDDDGNVDIKIQACDLGPGIQNLDLAMQDRFSTGTSLGLGLPGVRRMADVFSINSKEGVGTTVHIQRRIMGKPTPSGPFPFVKSASRISANTPHLSAVESIRSTQFDIASYSRPMPGEVRSGDIASIFELSNGLLISLVDVSGHGTQAYELAEEIRKFLASTATTEVIEMMTVLHDRLRGTRGAAVSLSFLNLASSTLTYCAVGNTGACRVIGQPWRPISKDGVLGHRLPTPLQDSVQLSNGDVILLWTDGLSEFPARNFITGQSHHSASALAKELVSALGRPYDDAGCIVIKWVA